MERVLQLTSPNEENLMSDTGTASNSRIATAVAGLVAVMFLGMSWYLVATFNTWEQVSVVYNAVCAVAFSAFGVLLGAKVQEVNVVRAVQTADKALDEAKRKSAAIKAATAVLQDDEAGGSAAHSGNSKNRRAALEILQQALD